jgi:hypothetical protein
MSVRVCKYCIFFFELHVLLLLLLILTLCHIPISVWAKNVSEDMICVVVVVVVVDDFGVVSHPHISMGEKRV